MARYSVEGSYGSVAFVRKINIGILNKSDLYIIKVEKEKNDDAFNLKEEIEMLKYLNNNRNAYPIMGFDYEFKSLNKVEKNENGIIFPDNFTTTTDYIMSQCLMAKAVYDAKTLHAYLMEANTPYNSFLQHLEAFIIQIFKMRNELNQPGFCHNDLHSGNIVFGKKTREARDQFTLIDFGMAYTDYFDTDEKQTYSARKEKQNQTFSYNNLTMRSIPFSYKNLQGCKHNLWADFAGLVKFCMNKKDGLQQFFDSDGVETTYPYISTCLYWFDNFYYLFNREFKQNVKIDSGTGLIYGPDYMKFFKIVIQKTNMDKVFSRGVPIDGIIQMGRYSITVTARTDKTAK